MSGPRIGKRGQSKDKHGRKKSNCRLVRLFTNEELYKTLRTGKGTERQKCRNELVSRNLPITQEEQLVNT